MRRLLLCCLISLPIVVFAETDDEAPIPPPPAWVTQGNAKAAPDVDHQSADTATPPLNASPEQPDLPMPVQSGENLEPDITITRRAQETVQEFRANGVLYMVKIIPDLGPAYYLIDSNGDGDLDVKRSDLDRGLKINMWKLFEWK